MNYQVLVGRQRRIRGRLNVDLGHRACICNDGRRLLRTGLLNPGVVWNEPGKPSTVTVSPGRTDAEDRAATL